MKSRTIKTTFVACALACATTLQLPLAARAQSGAGGAGQASGGSVSINNQAGRVQIRLDRGSKVAVSNRYGRITVTGWDRDTVEAVAVSSKGVAEAVQLEMTADPQQSRSTVSLAVVGRSRQSTLFAPAATLSAAQSDMLRKAEAMTAEQVREFERRYSRQVEEQMKAKEKSQADKEKDRDREKDKEKDKGRSETPEGGVVIVQPPSVTGTTPGVTVTTPGVTVTAPGVTIAPAQPGGVQPPAQLRPAPAPRPGTTVWGTARSADEIHLDVKVPRYAELATISVSSGDFNVSNLDGPVTVETRGGNVTASRVGALTVRSRGGDVNVDGVEGMVYVVANSGDITVRNAGSEVRATTNNGDINVACARGRVDVSTAHGKIGLSNIGGDVDAVTTNSDINYAGAITDGGRYRLKSMEGRVVMSIPDNSPGFTANLMSYNREAASEFAVRTSTPNPSGKGLRRVESNHGNGRAVILLDSFSHNVQLTKLATAVATACR